MTVKVSSLKKGQRVRIVVEGVVNDPSAADIYLRLDSVGDKKSVYIGHDHPSLKTLELVDDPIVQGTKVALPSGSIGVVLFQDGGKSWVRSGNSHGTYLTDSLRNADFDKDC